MFDYFTVNNLLQFIKIILNISGVWIAFYFVLKIVKNNSRTIQIFKGILLIFIVKGLAGLLGLDAIEYLANLFMQYGPIAIIIIFQPEIRSLLEKIGKTNVFSRISTLTLNEREKLVDELVKACTEMSKTKTGALISLEQGHSLSDYIKTGTPMNSVVTSELLCSIFVPGTPLHDGAVILQGVKIACAAAYFPPTTQDLATMYGARHRAAVGISEITDSITIIVSEETGNISIAEGGKLTVVSEKSLRDFLTMVICLTQNEVSKNKIRKESDAEKDMDVLDKEKAETLVKPSMISSLFRNKTKNKTEKNSAVEKKYAKTKKGMAEQKQDEDDASKRTDQKVEKIGIANLVEESIPLDNLFESIISDTENKKTQGREPVKKATSPFVKAQKERNQTQPLKKPVVKATPFMEQSINVETDGKVIVEKAKPSVKKKEEKIVPVQEAKVEAKEEKEKPVIKRSHVEKINNSDIASLLDDVIEPEAIVLNYKAKKDDNTSLSNNKKEGSDE